MAAKAWLADLRCSGSARAAIPCEDRRMIVETFPVGPLQCNCTILGDPATGAAIVVDPGDEIDRVMERLAGHGLHATSIIHTHAHIDHIGGSADLARRTMAPLLLHDADRPLYEHLDVQAEMLGLDGGRETAATQAIVHGEELHAGSIAAQILHTPGHTPGSCTLRVALPGGTLLLTGDTLFRGSIGRTDLWGGNFAQIVRSIHERLLTLDDAARVIPGHGPDTTIGFERTRNPFLRE